MFICFQRTVSNRFLQQSKKYAVPKREKENLNRLGFLLIIVFIFQTDVSSIIYSSQINIQMTVWFCKDQESVYWEGVFFGCVVQYFCSNSDLHSERHKTCMEEMGTVHYFYISFLLVGLDMFDSLITKYLN